MKISDIRTEYMRESLDEASVAPDPFRQFEHWFAEALKSQLREANAMTLATVAADGRPSSRVVLLKEFDQRGFVFYTNYESRKGRDLASSPLAALLFFWADLERQVRIEGAVAPVSAEESSAYFATRPRAAQIGAWASPQSEAVASRAAIEERVASVQARYGEAGTMPCPGHWGGYRLTPDMLEFWQGRPSRLHDRIRYRRTPERPDAWTIDRLAP